LKLDFSVLSCNIFFEVSYIVNLLSIKNLSILFYIFVEMIYIYIVRIETNVCNYMFIFGTGYQ